MPLAVENDLVPPIDDGGDLASFVSRLKAEWPSADARFSEWTERGASAEPA